jgi:hypothetical protein
MYFKSPHLYKETLAHQFLTTGELTPCIRRPTPTASWPRNWRRRWWGRCPPSPIALPGQALGGQRQTWQSIASIGSRAAVQLSPGTTALELDTLPLNGVVGSAATLPLAAGGDVDALEAVVAQQATALEFTEGATMRVQRTTPRAAEDRAPTPGVTSLTSTANIRWNESYTVILNVM